MIQSLSNKIFWLLSFVRPYKWNYAICIMLMILQSIVTLGTVSIQKWIVDDIFMRGMYDKLPVILGFFIGLFVMLSVLYVLVAYYTFKNNGDTQYEVSRHVLRYLQCLPIPIFQQERIGTYLYYFTNDSNLVSRLLALQCTRGFQNVVSLLLLICTLWYVNPLVLIPCFLIGLYYFIFGRLVSFQMKSITKQVHASRSKLMVYIEEAISATREIIAFNRERGETKRFNEISSAYYNKVMDEGRMTNKQLIISEPAKWGIHLSVLGFGGYEVMQSTISLGTFIVVYQFMVHFMSTMQNLFNFWMEISRHWASVERLHTFLEGERIESGNLPLQDATLSLSFSNVSFAYSPKGQLVLNSLSMDIPPGKKVALVGPSGSGKSTVAQLLTRFYEPQAGSIEVNGVTLSELNRKDWMNRIAMVFQEPYLFPDTIRVNLLLGLKNVSEEKMVEVCRAAHIHDEIVQLQDGYETVLGERGITLSGGQRQRLTLARAMLRDPEILILDEATFALDLETERQVQRELDVVRKTKTTVVIAHRLSTIQNSDIIFVLDRGRIAEQGTHEELMVNGSIYKQLVLQHTI